MLESLAHLLAQAAPPQHPSTDWVGVAAVLVSAGMLVLAIGAARRSASADKTSAVATEKVNTVEVKADSAKARADQALDATAEHTGAFDEMRRQLSEMQSEHVRLSTATGEQLAASMRALSDCEARHSEKDAAIDALRGEVRQLAEKVDALGSK